MTRGGNEARKLRLLFVLEYFYPHVGGGENLFKNLTQALARQGHEVIVVTLRVPGTAREEVLGGVKVIRVTTPSVADRYFFTFLALPAVIRLSRWADIIHTTIFNAAIPAWIGSFLSRRPAVLTVHEVFGAQWINLPGLSPLVGQAYRLFEKAMLRLPFRHFICDSYFTEERLYQLYPKFATRTSMIYPSVDYAVWDQHRYHARDLRSELGLSPDTFIYLFFGRPGISKGVEYLIEAAAQVRTAAPHSHLVLLLGRKPPAQHHRMLRKVEDFGLGSHVTILSMVPGNELPTYLLAADCVVVPSISEGFGYSAVEAATIGCRVVATSGHSVAEVLAGSAHFVPPRDSAALAAAIVEEASGAGPTLREVPRYKMATNVNATAAVYERILERRHWDTS